MANGYYALYHNTTGTDNTAIGKLALWNSALGSNNMALGSQAGENVVTASDVICIGAYVAGADVSHTTWIGNVYGHGYAKRHDGASRRVRRRPAGHSRLLGTFKKDIATMEKTSEAILSLRPVTFHYKTDTKGIPQFGLIAEEVAKVNPALVLPDKEGKPFTVRYDAVNAMLLNEFLKEHRRCRS